MLARAGPVPVTGMSELALSGGRHSRLHIAEIREPHPVSTCVATVA